MTSNPRTGSLIELDVGAERAMHHMNDKRNSGECLRKRRISDALNNNAARRSTCVAFRQDKTRVDPTVAGSRDVDDDVLDSAHRHRRRLGDAGRAGKLIISASYIDAS